MRDALCDLVLFVQLKNVKNANGEALLLVKLQASACSFTKISSPSWVFFHVFKILQRAPNRATHLIDTLLLACKNIYILIS